jgi:hypothetical protein
MATDSSAFIAGMNLTDLLRVLAVAGVLGTGQVEAAENLYDGNWRFSVTPYLWLPSTNAALRFDLPSGSSNVSASKRDILEKLNFALMATGDVRKGDWSLFTDFIYLNLSNQNAQVKTVTGPGGIVEVPVNIGTHVKLKGFLWTLAASYTLVREPRVSLDVFAGFRDAQMKPRLDWEFAGPLGLTAKSGTVSRTAVVWDGIIGIKGRVGLDESGTWFIPYYADVGWGGSSSTWQALGGLGYAFRWGDLSLTYRYLHYSTDGNRAIDNLALQGPALAATFRL